MDLLFPYPARRTALGILPPHPGRDDRSQYNPCDHCRVYLVLLVHLYDKIPDLDLFLLNCPDCDSLGFVSPDAGCYDLGERPPLHRCRRNHHLLLPLLGGGEIIPRFFLDLLVWNMYRVVGADAYHDYFAAWDQ